MNAVTSALVTALVTAAACGHHPSGPVLLESPATQQPAWATVSLTVSGDEADDGKRESCVEEARTAGIQLAARAPVAGTLYFLDHDDYLEADFVPNYVFGAMGSNATCRISLARLTKLDTLVPMTKGEPTGCELTGRVEGSDTGYFSPPSYDAAVVAAQFQVRTQGGNLFVQDVTRQEGARVLVNGRSFRCAR